MTARDEVRELRATIEVLTGRRPVSYDVDHLRRRLTSIAQTSMVVRNNRTPISSVIVPLDDAHAKLLAELATGANCSPQDIMRRAFVEYAVRQGRGVEVERAKKGVVR